MSGDLHPRLTFGSVAPCRSCRGTGQVRGSGMDDRQRNALRRAGEPIPTMHPCDECEGRGYLDTATADGADGRRSVPPPIGQAEP